MSRIFRQQQDLAVGSLESLNGSFSVNHRGHDLTVLGDGLLANDCAVTVDDRGIDHGVSIYLEQEEGAFAHQPPGQHDAVSHFEDVGYRARAQDITDVVTSVVPELTESVPDLAGKLMAARNELAHHLVLGDKKEPFDRRLDRWVVISYVTPWLLRLLLLLHAGIEPGALRTACLGSQRFGFFRANVAAISRYLGWAARLASLAAGQ